MLNFFNHNPNSVVSHFEKVAETYGVSAKRWPWIYIRQGEAAAVVELLGSVQGEDVLELGCGAGFYTDLLIKLGASHVTAVDLLPEMVEQMRDKEHITGVIADATSYQYHKSASIILSAGLIEFLSDPALFLANARRQLKESGAMVILGPRKNLFGQIYRFYHLSHGISVRLFGHEELEELARDAGWRIRKSEIIPPFAQAFRMEPVT